MATISLLFLVDIILKTQNRNKYPHLLSVFPHGQSASCRDFGGSDCCALALNLRAKMSTVAVCWSGRRTCPWKPREGQRTEPGRGGLCRWWHQRPPGRSDGPRHLHCSQGLAAGSQKLSLAARTALWVGKEMAKGIWAKTLWLWRNLT